MACPGDACAQDNSGAVNDGEFVVAGGQAAPLFEQCEGSFDEIALLVACFVEGRRSPTSVSTA